MSAPEGSSPPPGATEGEDEAPRRRWYRRPAIVVPVAVVVVGLGVGIGLFLRAWADRGGKQASVQESVEGFREDQGGGAAAGLLRPTPGVYTYDAEGSEELSVLDTGQKWGPTMPATVTTDDEGCWTLLLEYNTNHRQWTTYCPRGGVQREVTGETEQILDFVATQIVDRTSFVCDPPGQIIRLAAEPGDSWEQSCEGRSESRDTTVVSAGTNTFVGVEPVEIGGERIDALHYRVERSMSGDQSGSETTHIWYDPTTGLPLRETRDVTAVTPSTFGDVTYREQGSFRLTSLEPRT